MKEKCKSTDSDTFDNPIDASDDKRVYKTDDMLPYALNARYVTAHTCSDHAVTQGTRPHNPELKKKWA